MDMMFKKFLLFSFNLNEKNDLEIKENCTVYSNNMTHFNSIFSQYWAKNVGLSNWSSDHRYIQNFYKFYLLEHITWAFDHDIINIYNVEKLI